QPGGAKPRAILSAAEQHLSTYAHHPASSWARAVQKSCSERTGPVGFIPPPPDDPDDDPHELAPSPPPPQLPPHPPPRPRPPRRPRLPLRSPALPPYCRTRCTPPTRR